MTNRLLAGSWPALIELVPQRNKLGTLRVANLSPTPTSKANDFRGPFGDI